MIDKLEERRTAKTPQFAHDYVRPGIGLEVIFGLPHAGRLSDSNVTVHRIIWQCVTLQFSVLITEHTKALRSLRNQVGGSVSCGECGVGHIFGERGAETLGRRCEFMSGIG